MWSATIGSTFKDFLLSPPLNWKSLLKENKSFTFYFSCTFCTQVSLFHLLQTSFSLSWEFWPKPEFGKCLHASCSKRQGLSAWPGILKLMLQRGWCVCESGCDTCRAIVPSHVSPWEPERAIVPLILGRVWGDLWAQSCEQGCWKTPPLQRLFTALGRE